MNDFTVIGNVNADIAFFLDAWPGEHSKVRATQTIIRQGGSAGNVACILARLGHSVAIVAAIGTDHFGDLCAAEFEGCGVDVSLIQRVAGQTGVAATMQSDGTKRIITSGGVNQDLDLDLLARSSKLNGTHLHWVASKSRDMGRAIDAAKSKAATFSCECNGLAPPDLIGVHNLLFMNSDEATRLVGGSLRMEMFCSEVAAKHLSKVILTEGPVGATTFSGAGEPTRVRLTSRWKVDDRTGGGDAFVAGYLSAWRQGRNEESCLQRALDVACAAICSGRRKSWTEINFA
jgi:sugar/nucleoside kinase (ribokinase family)